MSYLNSYGLPLEVILDIEELADSVVSAREAIDEFSSTLKQVRTPRETTKQLELAGFHNLVGRSQNHLYQLACRARDWVAEVQKNVEKSSANLIESFSIDEKRIERLWRKQEEE